MYVLFVPVDDITLDVHLGLLQEVDTSVAYLTRPLDILNIPSHVFAQQLTYVDSVSTMHTEKIII